MAFIYDLGINESENEVYIKNLKNLWKYNDLPIDDLQFRLVHEKGINLWNSGAYISKITYKLIFGLESRSSIDEIFDYRIEMLIVLLKLSQVNLNS